MQEIKREEGVCSNLSWLAWQSSNGLPRAHCVHCNSHREQVTQNLAFPQLKAVVVLLWLKENRVGRKNECFW